MIGETTSIKRFKDLYLLVIHYSSRCCNEVAMEIKLSCAGYNVWVETVAQNRFLFVPKAGQNFKVYL